MVAKTTTTAVCIRTSGVSLRSSQSSRAHVITPSRCCWTSVAPLSMPSVTGIHASTITGVRHSVTWPVCQRPSRTATTPCHHG